MICLTRGIMSNPEDHPQLILYYRPSCPFCIKVLNHLDTIQKSVSLKNLNDDPKAIEELIHLGGKKQVPCLFIDGIPLYESQDIMDWLEEHKESID